VTVPGILAKLVSRDAQRDAYGAGFATAVLSKISSSPALLYSLMFAELIHNRVLRNVKNGPALELEVGTRAIHYVSREMQDPRQAVSDANIWAVVVLGYSGREAPLRTGAKYPRQSFLKELQSLHIYCKMEIVVEHVLGLMKLVELMGGLDKIRIPGMAQVVSLSVTAPTLELEPDDIADDPQCRHYRRLSHPLQASISIPCPHNDIYDRRKAGRQRSRAGVQWTHLGGSGFGILECVGGVSVP